MLQVGLPKWLFVGCSDPLFGQLLADLLPTHRTWSVTRLFKRLIFVLHMGDLAETRCGVTVTL